MNGKILIAFLRRDFLFLACAFVIFLLVLLPETRHNVYYHDEFLFIQQAQQLSSDPLAAWTPNYGFRRHPLYMHLLYVENQLFNLDPLPYFLTLFLLHFFNALLVARLCKTLGGDEWAQKFSGLLFLCSSAFSTTLIAVHVTLRVLCLFMFLLATLAWIEFLSQRRLTSWVKTAFFQTMSLMTMEDAMVFPVLMLFLTWRIVPKGRTQTRFWVVPLVALALLAGSVLFLTVHLFLSSSYRVVKVTGDVHWIPKAVSLLEMFIRPHLVPDRGLLPSGYVPEDILRTIPIIVAFLATVILLGNKERRSFFLGRISGYTMGTGAGWIAITVLPFITHPQTFEEGNRLMYFPMVGFCMFFGTLASGYLETVCRFYPRKGLPLFCATVIFFLGLNLANTSHVYRKYQRYMREHIDPGYLSLREKTSRGRDAFNIWPRLNPPHPTKP